MTLVDRSVRRQFTAAMALALALALVVGNGAFAQATANEVAAVEIDDSCNNVPEDGFPDVPETNTFDDEIECLKAYGITIGKSDGTYAPSGKVARWQMALFIYRLALEADAQLDELDLPEPNGDAPFTDLDGVDPDAVDAIEVLSEIGVVEGKTATTYDPGTSIRRDQMASFINRLQDAIADALGVDGFETSEDFFPDDNGNVHEANINALASVGIVQGKVTGKYNPAEKVNRGQMAAFIMRHYEVNVDNGVLESKYPADEGPGANASYTDAPELISAEIGASNSSETEVEFTFDEEVISTVDTNQFYIEGADGVEVQATDTGRSSSDSKVVEATFDNEDVDIAVAAWVDDAAVEDPDGNTNPTGSAGLQSVTIDMVNGFPELASIGNFNDGADTVEFTFDEAIDDSQDVAPANATADLGETLAGDFVLILEDGSVIESDAAGASTGGTADDKTVKVEFTGDGITQADYDSVARAYVVADTVADGDGEGNTPLVIDVSSDGATASAYPDLDGVQVFQDDDRAIFDFDTNVVEGTIDPTGFLLVEGNGTVIVGDAADRDDDDLSKVEITFNGDLSSSSGLIAYATVLDDAVDSLSKPNRPDSAGASTVVPAGQTNAPDPTSVDVSRDNVGAGAWVVTLTFDEDVKNALGAASEDLVAGYDSDGDNIDSSGGDVTDDDGDDVLKVTYTAGDDLFDALEDEEVAAIAALGQNVADDGAFDSFPKLFAGQ